MFDVVKLSKESRFSECGGNHFGSCIFFGMALPGVAVAQGVFKLFPLLSKWYEHPVRQHFDGTPEEWSQ